MLKKIALITIILLMIGNLHAQQTVGLYQNDSLSFNGYTLVAPSRSSQVYLIDNCGKLIHEWTTSGLPRHVTYLLDDGNLLRVSEYNDPDSENRAAVRRIEKINENSELVWFYDFPDPNYQPHHDLEVLPNGNILAIIKVKKTAEEAILAGRNPETTPETGLNSENIIEIKPIGSNEIEIVWEWKTWDHLIQDFDPEQENFGNVAEHPELINVNFTPSLDGSFSTEWLHINSVDYNPDLNQIALSIFKLHEFWVLDHNSGEMVYRWGNPQSYNRGNEDDKVFYGLHDVQWIEGGLEDAGKLMIYNNGNIERDYSTIEIIEPPVDESGNYTMIDNEPFGPSDIYWSYGDGLGHSFYSEKISGCERQPGGSTLICEGMKGRIFEIDRAKNIVWEYINPVNESGPVTQGDVVIGNNVFRSYRFPADFSGLPSDLTPNGPIELDPLPYDCTIYPEITTSISELNLGSEIKIFPNPAYNTLNIVFETGLLKKEYKITDIAGKVLVNNEINDMEHSIDISSFSNGLYFIVVDGIAVQKLMVQK